MIDGIYIDQHVVLIALGFDETGAKHVLGVQEGATENCVKRWRGGSMILRWIGATIHELQRGFHRIKGYRGMKDLVTALRTRDAQLDPPIDVAEKVA